MDAPGWLSQRQADVPPGDRWLGDSERRVQARLKLDRRRADWRLGRWTAKQALAARLEVSLRRLEVLAATDGAPEAWLDGELAAISVSLSHRAGRALAAVTAAPCVAGCDLEVVEPRSDAFIREWLAPPEQGILCNCSDGRRAQLANLIWCAKEAAAKVRREGLRLDVRRAVVTFAGGGADPEGWRPLQVRWPDGPRPTSGWWRSEPGWVMTVAGEPAPSVPHELASLAPSTGRA
jgi:4'-phosphopantetheinyl transferase